jgi:uncharacterized protein YlxW (UPF0749 family)
MQLAISNQVSQIEAQIAELASRRKELEAKWAKLEIREMQIQDASKWCTSQSFCRHSGAK